jgi:hypothetical protein
MQVSVPGTPYTENDDSWEKNSLPLPFITPDLREPFISAQQPRIALFLLVFDKKHHFPLSEGSSSM